MKLSDIVLMSDIDGTLLKDYGEIPRRNIDALRRFVDKGGRFGIATGRSIEFTRLMARQLPVNMPCVVYNGSGVYDYARDELLVRQYLPPQSLDCLKALMEKFPQVRYFVATEKWHYDVTEGNAKIREGYNNPFVRPARLSEVEDTGWFKFLMYIDPELMAEVRRYGERLAPELRFVPSYIDMLEIIPPNASKASALVAMMKLFSITPEQLACIGDYYNDIEMLKLAGVGATLETAPDDIKSIAKVIVCKCEDGAVAEFVERLEAMYE